MNYLAHIHLSGANMRIAVGNFIGDGVKGRITDEWPIDIQLGLHLHRFIDYTADTDPINAQGRKAMRSVFGKYAGIAQDMIHDHYLARLWNKFHEDDLEAFLDRFYQEGELLLNCFPNHQQRFFEASRAGNWLANYRDIESMDRSFKGLSKRVRRENPLSQGAAYIEAHDEILEAQFLEFYPILLSACRKEHERLLTIL